MQAHLDKVLEQHATCAMDEALGLTCRARGEQHVGGVIERQALERRRLRISERCAERLDHCSIRGGHGDRVISLSHEHHAHRRQCRENVSHVATAREVLAVPVVRGGGHEHGGLELAETVDDRRRPELRRHTADHRTDRERAQRAYEGVRANGQDQPDAITGLNTMPAQGGRE